MTCTSLYSCAAASTNSSVAVGHISGFPAWAFICSTSFGPSQSITSGDVSGTVDAVVAAEEVCSDIERALGKALEYLRAVCPSITTFACFRGVAKASASAAELAVADPDVEHSSLFDALALMLSALALAASSALW